MQSEDHFQITGCFIVVNVLIILKRQFQNTFSLSQALIVDYFVTNLRLG